MASMMKKHRMSKPKQLESVAGGVLQRLESNLQHRKSTRRTSFDDVRDIKQASPEPTAEVNPTKLERRRQQLEKWKAEKENMKKLLAAQKKKPFVASAAQSSHPLKYVPLPPFKSVSGISGCISSSHSTIGKKEEIKRSYSQSIAPKHTGFHAPKIKTMTKSPTNNLAPPRSKKDVVTAFMFNPVVPVTKPAPMQTRSRACNKIVAESQQNKNKAKNIKPTQPLKPVSKILKAKVQSSSSSENEHMQSTTSSSNVDLTAKMVSFSSEDNSDCKYSTSSSSNVDLTAKMVSTSSEDNSDCKYSTSSSSIVDLTAKMVSTSSEDNSDCKYSTSSSSNVDLTAKIVSTSSEDNSDCKYSTSSSSNVDLTAKMVSSNSEDNSDCIYLTGNDNSRSLKTLQSSSGEELLSSKCKFPPRKSINPSEKKLNAPKNPVPCSESSSKENLRSPKSPQDVPMTPEQLRKISPCATLSRSKAAHKAMTKKMVVGVFEEDVSDMESVEHFRRQLSSDIKRMKEMCDTWDNIYKEIALPDFVQELVLGAVGEARLLMSQKMQQFASLVQSCARPDPSSPLVTLADLQGFWDMLFMQVQNVDMQFKKLEELRAHNWAEEKENAKPRLVRQNAVDIPETATENLEFNAY